MARILPGGVPVHELYIAAALGAFMGVAGFYVARALGPKVAALTAAAPGA